MLKSLVNGVLRRFGLRVIRWRTQQYSGQYLFEDLAKVLTTDSPLCLDVGANVGQTIDALHSVFASPTIHSFEPSRATFERLQQRRFPAAVHLHRMALGAQAGSGDFLNYEEPLLSSFLQPADAAGNPFRAAPIVGRETVPVGTVDAFTQEHGITDIDLLKIDTQGFDLEVIKGAQQLLAAGRIRTVMVEINFMDLYVGQPTPSAVLDYLAQRGMHLLDLYEKEYKGTRLGWCTALFVRS